MNIPLIKQDEVTSTSTLAMENLRAGTPAPFAIWARRQSAGRGRMGHTWQSTDDGLYLSIALPTTMFADYQSGLLSLRTAILVADWLRQQLGFRATLKWPNDLLFAGAKFGGILCESDFQGTQAKGLVIGIGFNVVQAPTLDDIRTTHLRAITGRTFSTEELACSLVDFFATHWCRDADTEIMSLYQQYALEPGQLWRGNDGVLDSLQGYDSEGALLLRRHDLETQRISSVQTAGAWIYQTPRAQPLVVADVGNSRTKLALYADSADDEPVGVYVPGDRAALPDLLADLRQQLLKHGYTDKLCPLHIGSVNPAAAELLRAQASQLDFAVTEISKRGILRLPASPYSLQELGVDRLAAIEATLAAIKHQQNASTWREDEHHIIVCAGTATTIDLVRGDGLHLGGRILPGLQVALDTLAQRAAQLPDHLHVPVLSERELIDNQYLLGHNTVAAMQFGVVAMTVASITDLARRLGQSASTNATLPTVHVCGGLAAALIGIPDARVDSNLVLKGLKSLAIGGALSRD